MKLKRRAKKKLITSSSNEQKLFNQSFRYYYKGASFELKIIDLVPFEKYKNYLSESNIDHIQKELKIKKGIISYKSSDGLKLYIYEANDHLVFIAMGEFQPSLYKIFIEGIFEKIN